MALLSIFAVLMPALIASIAGAVPAIASRQSNAVVANSNNGCADNPASPNPSTILNLPVTPTVPFLNGSTVVVFVAARDQKPTNPSGPCTAPGVNAVLSVTDTNSSVFTRRWSRLIETGVGNWAGVQIDGEIWATAPGLAKGGTSLTVHFDGARLNVQAISYEFQNVASIDAIVTGNYTNPVTDRSGYAPRAVSWTNIDSLWLGFTFARTGAGGSGAGCGGEEPDCIWPAVGPNPAQGGYNETHLTIACTVPKANLASCNSGPNGGDNRSKSVAEWLVNSYRVKSNQTGSHSFYHFTTSPVSDSTAFVGVMLNPALPPPEPSFSEGFIVSGFILFVFMAVLVLAVMGAVWLRHRFS